MFIFILLHGNFNLIFLLVFLSLKSTFAAIETLVCRLLSSINPPFFFTYSQSWVDHTHVHLTREKGTFSSSSILCFCRFFWFIFFAFISNLLFLITIGKKVYFSVSPVSFSLSCIQCFWFLCYIFFFLLIFIAFFFFDDGVCFFLCLFLFYRLRFLHISSSFQELLKLQRE